MKINRNVVRSFSVFILEMVSLMDDFAYFTFKLALMRLYMSCEEGIGGNQVRR